MGVYDAPTAPGMLVNPPDVPLRRDHCHDSPDTEPSGSLRDAMRATAACGKLWLSVTVPGSSTSLTLMVTSMVSSVARSTCRLAFLLSVTRTLTS